MSNQLKVHLNKGFNSWQNTNRKCTVSSSDHNDRQQNSVSNYTKDKPRQTRKEALPT